SRGRMLSFARIAPLARSVPINRASSLAFANLMSANGLVDIPNGGGAPWGALSVAPFGHPMTANDQPLSGPWMGSMDSFLLRGGNRLKGKIEVSGSKNSALPIVAACLLAEGKTTLHSVPRLSDIDSMNKLIGELGCHVYRHESKDSVAPDGPALNGPLDITVTD